MTELDRELDSGLQNRSLEAWQKLVYLTKSFQKCAYLTTSWQKFVYLTEFTLHPPVPSYSKTSGIQIVAEDSLFYQMVLDVGLLD